METLPASKPSCFFKKLDDEQSARAHTHTHTHTHTHKTIMSVNFTHALCSLDTLAFEGGIDMLSHNIGYELPLYAV